MSLRTLSCASALVAAMGGASAAFAQLPVTFDFDKGTPVLTLGQRIPFGQLNGGVRAVFSSPTEEPFCIVNDQSVQASMPVFTDQYLCGATAMIDALRIDFNRPVLWVTMKFATMDHQDVMAEPSIVLVRMQAGPAAQTTVGSYLTRAAYGENTFPTGVLFAGGRPFAAMTIGLQPGQSVFTPGLLVDTIEIMPSPCAADYDADGTFEPIDIFDYINDWFAGRPRADFNGDGQLAVQDIFDFIDTWMAGCG